MLPPGIASPNGKRRADVEKRVQTHWHDDGFPVDGSWNARVAFLYRGCRKPQLHATRAAETFISN